MSLPGPPMRSSGPLDQVIAGAAVEPFALGPAAQDVISRAAVDHRRVELIARRALKDIVAGPAEEQRTWCVRDTRSDRDAVIARAELDAQRAPRRTGAGMAAGPARAHR
jgi:hypothetical protein